LKAEFLDLGRKTGFPRRNPVFKTCLAFVFVGFHSLMAFQPKSTWISRMDRINYIFPMYPIPIFLCVPAALREIFSHAGTQRSQRKTKTPDINLTFAESENSAFSKIRTVNFKAGFLIPGKETGFSRKNLVFKTC